MAKRKTKRCPDCHNTKSVTSFSKDHTRSDGLQSYCKVCRKAMTSEWLKKNPGFHLKNERERRTGSVEGFLEDKYRKMSGRVKGLSGEKKYRHYWFGKPIMPKETFIEWSRNHPDFLRLFKRWKMSREDRKLVPSVNRINSDKGYTLDNIEWVTASQNSSLAGAARSFNTRRAIYELLKDVK